MSFEKNRKHRKALVFQWLFRIESWEVILFFWVVFEGFIEDDILGMVYQDGRLFGRISGRWLVCICKPGRCKCRGHTAKETYIGCWVPLPMACCGAVGHLWSAPLFWDWCTASSGDQEIVESILFLPITNCLILNQENCLRISHYYTFILLKYSSPHWSNWFNCF